MDNAYEFLDSGEGLKLERFGPYILQRPAAQAVWKKRLASSEWNKAHAIFTREPDNRWIKKVPLPHSWTCDIDGIIFKIQPTDFGHLGMFAEQRPFWSWIRSTLQKQTKPTLLNLFAYSGGVTLAAARGGAEVCHLDASKGMCDWARENAKINKLESAPIRWITDDVMKFLDREIKRGRKYDAIVLDPPTFGRGAKGEMFKIEELITPLIQKCIQLFSDTPLFLLFSCHTPGFTPQALQNLLEAEKFLREKGRIESGEMLLQGAHTFALPSGAYARWSSVQ